MAEILLPISVQMEIAGAEHTASEIVKVAEAEKKVAKEAKNAQHETTICSWRFRQLLPVLTS